MRNPGTLVFPPLISTLTDYLTAHLSFPAYLQNMLFLMLEGINTLYDNSKPFSTFLMKEGLEDILRETELGLRQKHTIVPHVCPYDFSLILSYFLF